MTPHEESVVWGYREVVSGLDQQRYNSVMDYSREVGAVMTAIAATGP